MSAGHADDAPLTSPEAVPHVEAVVGEGVSRALVSFGARSLRLRVCGEGDRPPGLARVTLSALDRQVEAFLAARAPVHARLRRPIANILLQTELLDAFEVPHGDKSIAMFMDAAWTPERAAVHGPRLGPPTLRHWRGVIRRRASRATRAGPTNPHGPSADRRPLQET